MEITRTFLNSFVDMKVLDLKAEESGIDRKSDEIQELLIKLA